ncbi:MAG: hypothetical protein ACD_62C00437G0002 [uncultured bacterium]|nr:MAG: hypothetical protein ACD_62C00437G0002 [uncultured bacterium]
MDLHCHLREPGFEYKETIESGTAAAVAGGFTSVCCMANTSPVNDNATVAEFILKKARETGHCHVYPIGAITKGLNGEELASIAELRDCGCVAISDDGNTIQNAQLMKLAFSYAKSFDLPIATHSCEYSLGKSGHMNSSIMSTKLGLAGIPNVAEDIIIARDIMLAELSGARLHIGHVSTSVGVRLIRAAKKRGMQLTCEVTPHHLTLTDEALTDYDTNFKMYPPLRSSHDVQTLREALKEGLFDAIATDHAPHGVIEKQLEFDLAAFGIIGLETALAVCLSLVRDNVLTLPQLIGLLTHLPAKVFALPAGTLAKNAIADITLFDPSAEWTVLSDHVVSKSKNTPWLGKKLTGKVIKTFVGGTLKYDALA